MSVLDSLSKTVENGGVWAGAAIIILSILRAFGLRASKDAITLKADGADRDAFNRLMQRVNTLDERVNELEEVRNHLFGFVTKCMGYISLCVACDIHNQTDRHALQEEYQNLLDKLSAHYHDRRREPRDEAN